LHDRRRADDSVGEEVYKALGRDVADHTEEVLDVVRRLYPEDL
jgi:hypothetical protein